MPTPVDLLPGDYEAIKFIEEAHGLTISPEEYQSLQVASSLNQVLTDTYYLSYEQLIVPKCLSIVFWVQLVRHDALAGFLILPSVDFVQNKVIGKIASVAIGIIGLVTGQPWLLAIASIGFKLFGSKQEQPDIEEQESGRSGNQTGFDTVASLVPPGKNLNMFFCSKLNNLAGGVRSSGFLIHCRVDTFKGSQRLYQLFSHGLGPIGAINETDLLINEQPRDNFFQDEIVTDFRLGTTPQTPINGFPFYSQCISPSSNNVLGVDMVATPEADVDNSTSVDVDGDVFDNISPSRRYFADGQHFIFTDKSGSGSVLTTNIPVTLTTNSQIFAVWEATYETSKRVSRVDFNFVFNLSARDTANDIVKHAVLALVTLTNLRTGQSAVITKIYTSNKGQSQIRRYCSIRNLELDRYRVVFTPLTHDDGSMPVYKMGDVGVRRLINTGVFFGAKEVQIEVEQETNHVQDQQSTNDNIAYTSEKRQVSSQNGAPGRITTVNEIVYPEDLGHTSVSGYPGQVVTSVIQDSSERLGSNTRYSWLIEEGLSLRQLVRSGTAGIGSTGNTLVDLTNDFSGLPTTGYLLRNLDRALESSVSSYPTGTSVTTNSGLSWGSNDRYLLYTVATSSYFPDIAAHLITSNNGGLGHEIDGDFSIDYPSFARSRQYCVDNNYFWDGVIKELQPWMSWASKESAASSLVHIGKINGRISCIPEEATAPTAIFNDSNIYSISEGPEQQQLLNSLVIIYRDGSDSRFRQETVLIQTAEASAGLVPLVEESLELTAVTNQQQAIAVGALSLKTRLLQWRSTVEMEVGLQGERVTVGDLILVQHSILQIQREVNGFVISNTRQGSSEFIELSGTVELGVGPGYTAAIHHFADESLEWNLPCSSYLDGNQQPRLRIDNVATPVVATSANRLGDIVMITQGSPLTYRVAEIYPDEETGRVKITAVIWNEDLLTLDGLVITT